MAVAGGWKNNNCVAKAGSAALGVFQEPVRDGVQRSKGQKLIKGILVTK